MKTLLTYQTKGGKYRKELSIDDNGYYSIINYKNNDTTGINSLGTKDHGKAMEALNKEIKMAAYYDNINLTKL